MRRRNAPASPPTDPHLAGPFPFTARLRGMSTGGALALLLAAVGAVGIWVLAVGHAERRAVEAVAADARHRLEIYANNLDSAVERFDYLPSVAARDPAVAALAAAGFGHTDPAEVDRVNRYLEAVNASAGSAVLYLMDAEGRTVASSNWNRPDSYLGVDFSYRPYFKDARDQGVGRFYGVGTVTRLPGYFIAAPVERDGRRVGVLAVKIVLDALEDGWRTSHDAVLVADRFGIVFLSSNPEWKFRARRPLDPDTVTYLNETREYVGLDHPPLVLPRSLRTHPDLLVERGLSRYGWTIALAADAHPVAQAAATARIGLALLLLLALAIGLYVRQRVKRLREQRLAKAALDRAYQDLERQVEARTADLRDAQAELVQAAKLAMIGQVAAGVTHELNQPLTALRALADNARLLLDQGRQAEVSQNLTHIAGLVDRMAKISSQLRNFSRRSEGPAQPVALPGAVQEALALLDRRLKEARVQVTVDVPEVTVAFDPVRLQQVLVNLIRNAEDATAGVAEPRIAITAVPALLDQRAAVRVTVADNGPGLDPAVRDRLFDPFVTTKPGGQGLGLGLAISLAITQEYGGQLEARDGDARDGENTGAVFLLTLPLTSVERDDPTA
ncbi:MULTISPECIES: sensor histidine kinase [Nitrospirillum]|uniref:C4-dicarboxylate transport sensor protein DctB n=1 Tax=Nitrospirillum amazonense TaxID=28077 RepID=A0A560FKQ6_9PROT|nr:ATP-binding protein [Nitrospirillum amazonense]MEC4590803.1 ATP-binding protein [Nitrospirillum amazonense]TWB22189.1 two-component system C4-dicarboxylate transport sensor histidine kinase DctB [Nitrospirillum amazonense]